MQAYFKGRVQVRDRRKKKVDDTLDFTDEQIKAQNELFKKIEDRLDLRTKKADKKKEYMKKSEWVKSQDVYKFKD